MLEVKGLRKSFTKGVFNKKTLIAVDGIDITIQDRETFGLVGESGCGKTTVGRLILRLIEPEAGNVMFNGEDITAMKRAELRSMRPKMQILFQDADSSLHPRMRIYESVAEPLKLYNLVAAKDIRVRVLELLSMVGLQEEHLNRYPHELSGGQNQRVVLARVLALGPKFIVADEPTSALDVSVQAQILSLIKQMQQRFGFSCLFISHDLGVIRKMTSHMGIMYLGKIVETGSTDRVFNEPMHPYTKALISAVHIEGFDDPSNNIRLDGEMPDPMSPPPGCKFHTRCPMSMEICGRVEPLMTDLGEGQRVACHLYG